MDIDGALELLIDGHAVLFAGAGFSRGAVNSNGEPVKTADELASRLASEAEISADSPLDDAAEEYIFKYGEASLASLLKTEFTVTNVSRAHKKIAEFPWRRIYTTNYDNVIEKAYSEGQRTITPVTLGQEPRLALRDPFQTLCIHLNGYVESLTSQSIGSELKLTDTSYLTASVRDSPWASMFRQDLKLAEAVFYVGYSLYDLDIRRILFETPQLREKSFFIVGKNPQEQVLRRPIPFWWHIVY